MKRNKEHAAPVRLNDLRGAAINLFALYTAAAAAALIISGKIIPMPLAEICAFAYVFAKQGKIVFAVLLAVVFVAALVLCFLLSKRASRRIAALKIPVFVVLAADLVIHAYVFLAAEGYQWNYLVSAFLDAVLAVLITVGEKHTGK
ncbi:MAG: hypothetical protein IJS45_00445 [Clostridia bacterium]|nr:hypothetical protein [Clostridia bacterium]